jgi:hypothetical protein
MADEALRVRSLDFFARRYSPNIVMVPGSFSFIFAVFFYSYHRPAYRFHSMIAV